MDKSNFTNALEAIGTTLKESVTETLWPTRCAICDRPGNLLCKKCRLSLHYIDQTQACPHCGGPLGFRQCTECNDIVLQANGLDRLPFQTCSNLIIFEERAKRIVVAFKDHGERRLARTMGHAMAQLANPSWTGSVDAVTYIPASAAAVKRRGFDHGQLLAAEVAKAMGKPCLGLLSRPKAIDQRELGRKGRVKNMSQAFRLNPQAEGRVPASVILVDDVMTTGSTLFAACKTLKEAGATEIHCLTFARAW